MTRPLHSIQSNDITSKVQGRRGISRRRHTPQAQVLAMLGEIAPRPWNLDTFLQRLSASIGRRIVVETADMPPEMTGVWLSTAATDYIFVTSNADCTRRFTIVVHEIVHILLGHRQSTDRGSHIGKLGFAAEPERDAELVATAFVSRLDLDGRVPGVSAAV